MGLVFCALQETVGEADANETWDSTPQRVKDGHKVASKTDIGYFNQEHSDGRSQL